MTWEELNKEYEKKAEKKPDSSEKYKNWFNLMESTNKIIWLYMMNDAAKKEKVLG